MLLSLPESLSSFVIVTDDPVAVVPLEVAYLIGSFGSLLEMSAFGIISLGFSGAYGPSLSLSL